MLTEKVLRNIPIEERIRLTLTEAIVGQASIAGTDRVDSETQKWYVHGLWRALCDVCEECGYDVDDDLDGLLDEAYIAYQKVWEDQTILGKRRDR